MEKENNQSTGIIQKTLAQSLEISDRVKRLANVLVEVNQVAAYPLTAVQVLEWCGSIEKIMPELDLKKLEFLIDAYKVDKLVWDRTKGIQNIFNGMKHIRESENGYEVFIVYKSVF